MKRDLLRKIISFRLIAIMLVIVMTIGVIPASAKTKKTQEIPSIEVSSKTMLVKQLKTEGEERIVFTTDDAVSVTIPSTKYSHLKHLVIRAEEATIINKAKFASISVEKVKSYTEKVSGNKMAVTADGANIDVAANKTLSKLTIDADNVDIEVKKKAAVEDLNVKHKSGATVNLNASNKAKVNVKLTKKTTLVITGDKGADVDVKSTNKNNSVETDIPVDITTTKKLNLTTNKGAEGTKVDKSKSNVKLKITNNSTQPPTVTVKGKATSTPTPEPTDTSTPTPTVTDVPTVTPTPTATEAPKPTTTVPTTTVPTQISSGGNSSGGGYSGGSSSGGSSSSGGYSGGSSSGGYSGDSSSGGYSGGSSSGGSSSGGASSGGNSTGSVNDTVHIHTYGTPSYSWTDDGKKCTASVSCTIEGCSETVTETVDSVGTVKTPATCTSKGTTTYTATFENSLFVTQTIDVEDIDILIYYVEINDANFPDNIFRSYIQTNFDKDADGKLSEEEVTAVTIIDVQQAGISNLAGIEFFNELESLWCSYNDLTKLDISNNKLLVDLRCGKNQLSELNIENNTLLHSLVCHENLITQLDISNNPKLILTYEEGDLFNADTFLTDTYYDYEYIDMDDNGQLFELSIDKKVSLSCIDNSVTITKQPESQTVKEYEKAHFNIVAEGKKPSYTWEYKYNGSDSWNICKGAQTSEIEISYRDSRDGMSLRCTVSDIYGNRAVSDEVILRYISNPESNVSDIYCSRPTPVNFEEGLSLDEMINLLPLDEELEDPIGTYYYYYRQLTPAQKVLYWKLEEIIGKNDTFTIGGVTESKDDDLYRAQLALDMDNPLFNLYIFGIEYSELTENNYKVKLITHKEFGDNGDYYTKQDKDIVLNNADALLSVVSSGLGEDRYTILRNLVTVTFKNVTYDHQEYFEGYPYVPTNHDMMGFFNNRECVCDGFAYSIKYLCDRLGIPCVFVEGTHNGEGHAWNYVRMEDEKWYRLDQSAIYMDESTDFKPYRLLVGNIEQDDDGSNIYVPLSISGGNFVFPTISDYKYKYDKVYEELESTDVTWDTLEYDGDFTYKVLEDGLTSIITGYSGKGSGDLVIPESIDGYTVVGIGCLAFYRSTFTGDIIIPDSVTEIASGAFLKCKNVEGNLILPEGLKIIGNLAFAFNPKMKGNVQLPESVISIGDSAFYGDEELIIGSMLLPNGIEYIGPYAFCYCSNLSGTCLLPDKVDFSAGIFSKSGISAFEVNATNEKYIIYEGSLYSKDGKILLACAPGYKGILKTASSTIEIADEACRYNKISGVELNEGLVKIGVRAFDLSEVSGKLILPNTLEYIGESAFSVWDDGNHGFTGDLIIPDSVTYIGMMAFDGNRFGGSLRLSENLTEIYESTFLNCHFSGDLAIPNSVKKIGSFAFFGNDYVFGDKGRLTLSENLTEIGDMAFYRAGLSGDIDVSHIVVGEEAFEFNFFDFFIQ